MMSAELSIGRCDIDVSMQVVVVSVDIRDGHRGWLMTTIVAMENARHMELPAVK
jgi:hypothetical protein